MREVDMKASKVAQKQDYYKNKKMVNPSLHANKRLAQTENKETTISPFGFLLTYR